jgi:hypothetical protein
MRLVGIKVKLPLPSVHSCSAGMVLGLPAKVVVARKMKKIDVIILTKEVEIFTIPLPVNVASREYHNEKC